MSLCPLIHAADLGRQMAHYLEQAGCLDDAAVVLGIARKAELKDQELDAMLLQQLGADDDAAGPWFALADSITTPQPLMGRL